MGAILFAVSTGPRTVLSYAATSSIRALNRILPFVAFAALVGGAWALHVLSRHIDYRPLRAVAIGAVGIVTLLDIVPRGMTEERRVSDIAEFDGIKKHFGEVEARVGGGAALSTARSVVARAPANQPDVELRQPNAYLPTKTLRFSAGAGRSRPGYIWGKSVKDLAAETQAMGFDAILIDSFGYTPHALETLTGDLIQALPEPVYVSSDERWWTFSLAGCCDPACPNTASHAVP